MDYPFISSYFLLIYFHAEPFGSDVFFQGNHRCQGVSQRRPPHLLLLPVYSQSARSSQRHPRQQTRCLANGALIVLLASLWGRAPACSHQAPCSAAAFLSAWLLWTPWPAGCLSAVGDGNGLVLPAFLQLFLTCSEI